MNIIWKQPNGMLAVTSICDGSDPVEHSALLKEQGNIDESWECVATSYNKDFPPGPLDTWAWDGTSIVVDPVRQIEFHNYEVNCEIVKLEGGDPLARASREFMLTSFAATAAAQGIDPTTSPSYVKIKALDDQIASLRKTRK